MAVKLTIEKHGVAYPSKVLAQTGGKHIYNITIEKDHDNGEIVAKGEFIELDRYKEADASGLKAKVVAPSPNGNWYVEIEEAGTALMLRNVPVTPYEFNREITNENVFYNEAGDTVRGYELATGDVVELSDDCFDAKVAVGDSVTATNGKWTKGE